jgi:IS4 transposase
MLNLGEKFEAFIEKAPAAVALRATLQRLLPAEKQYEKTLLFSTLMTLMFEVTLKSTTSLHKSYLKHRDSVPVSVAAVYQKTNNLEPNIAAELVRYSFKRLRPALQQNEGEKPPLVPGLRSIIVDGNHFAATQHRLVGTRRHQAPPLPGFAIALYDPQCQMVFDLLPCEDGHTQERALLPELAERVAANDLWIADRNFCTIDFMFAVQRKGAYFLIRHHGQLKKWVAEGERKRVGTTETGEVFEQQISLTDATGKKMRLRRITVQLFKKTRDGDTEIHILTNASKKQLSSVRASECYRERWDIEGMFLELTQSLKCEVDTLAYPKAAIFAFSLAVLAYNAISLFRGTLGGVHGFEYVEQKLSWNILCSDTSSAWRGVAWNGDCD